MIICAILCRLFYPKTVAQELSRLLTAGTDKNFTEGTGKSTSLVFVCQFSREMLSKKAKIMSLQCNRIEQCGAAHIVQSFHCQQH